MGSSEVFYDLNSIVLTAFLFIAIVAANELGFRIGRFVQIRADTEAKSLTGSIQASILGLLALLLGFTFSMAMQRYDSRNQALIEEANAISTATLRARLLPEEHREAATNTLREYARIRIDMATIDATETEERATYEREIARLQDRLWEISMLASEQDARAVTTGAFLTALTVVFDAEDKRTMMLLLHVPETVLMLLFFVFVSSGGILGYSAGLGNERIVLPSLLVALLISLIVFIIIDLDRPRRGLIQVDQTILRQLA